MSNGTCLGFCIFVFTQMRRDGLVTAGVATGTCARLASAVFVRKRLKGIGVAIAQTGITDGVGAKRRRQLFCMGKLTEHVRQLGNDE